MNCFHNSKLYRKKGLIPFLLVDLVAPISDRQWEGPAKHLSSDPVRLPLFPPVTRSFVFCTTCQAAGMLHDRGKSISGTCKIPRCQIQSICVPDCIAQQVEKGEESFARKDHA